MPLTVSQWIAQQKGGANPSTSASTAPVLPPAAGPAPQPVSSPQKMSISDWIQKAKSAPAPALPGAQTQIPTPGIFSRIGSDFNSRVNKGADSIEQGSSGQISKPSAALQDIGQGAGFVGDIGGEILKSAGDSVTGTDNSGKKTSLTDVFSGAMKAIGKTAPAEYIAQKVNEFSTKHPEAAGDLGAIFNIASILPEGGAADAIGEGVANAAKGTVSKVGDVAEEVKVAASKSNAIPTLESSAERISEKSILPKAEKSTDSKGTPMKQGIGSSAIADPAALHEKYFNQERKALADTKQDTALGLVGTDIGNAFQKVVNMKNKAGSMMGEELDKVGSIKTDVSKSMDDMKSELEKVGLKYSPASKSLRAISRGAEIPVTSSDRNLLNKYIKSATKLGTNPSVKNIDAFMKRIPDDLKVYKAKNGIIGTTNGERIIKKHLASLRDSLEPVKDEAGNIKSGSELEKYSTARKSYAGLSKFIEEGVPFLGKKTQTGDFAKDASLAKSSVQSVLNNGKKDWLMKLEQYTGEPLLDKATLALQAMKDAGDYRGESLLQLLSQEGAKIPKSPSGLIEKVVGFGLKAGKNAALGSNFDQTQRLLKSISKKSTGR